MNLSRKLLDRGKRCRVNFISESCGESHSSQHAQFVFREPQFRVADSANDSGFEIVLAIDEVQNLVVQGIEQQAIDRKIASLNILFRITTEPDSVGMPPIAVAYVAAES